MVFDHFGYSFITNCKYINYCIAKAMHRMAWILLLMGSDRLRAIPGQAEWDA